MIAAAVTASAAAAQAVPVITHFAPTSGLAGTALTISGTDLDTANTVLIGGVAATIVSDSATSIHTTIPAGATTGVISVHTKGGRATSTKAVTVLALSSFSPTGGPFGTTVTITGSGFNASSTVQAHGVSAAILKRTATELQFNWPQAATNGPISVTNTSPSAGTVTSAGPFVKTVHAGPAITSFSPASGVTGSSVTISGTNFTAASAVTFGTRTASFTVVSATEITATVPNGAATGAIAVSTAAGVATSTTSFTPMLSITGVSPALGAAGTPVTIRGTGFTDSSTVTFNGTPATVMSRTLPGRLVVSVPAAAPGGPITVTNTVVPTGTVDSVASFNPEICGTSAAPPTYTHVIVVFEENNSFDDIIGAPGAPYLNTLASQCGLATSYHSITHPSLPEYMAATSGATLTELTPFEPDCTPSASCDSAADNIFHQASSWKGYAESMPTNCDIANSDLYAARHNPAVYYTDLSDCATDDVPLGTTSSSPLLTDFQSDLTAPAVATVSPDLCDDMHGHKPECPKGSADLIGAGDSWLKQWLPLIASTPVYQSGDTAIFIVWDEGEGPTAAHGEQCAVSADPTCHIPAIVIAPSVTTKTRSSTPFTHYSLLKTIEDLLGLPELDSAITAQSMAAAFNL